MTMPHPIHPDDERLAALAGAEPDALADPSLIAHVDGCERCTGVVDDLRMLRHALADLPDLPPSRPLRFLPPAPEPSVRAPWVVLVRRLTTPLMGVATVLILVGVVGSAGSLGLAGAGGAPASFSGVSGAASEKEMIRAPTTDTTSGTAQPSAASADARGGAAAGPSTFSAYGTPAPATPQQQPAGTPPGGEPPYPWILGTGVVLLAAGFVLRGATAPDRTA